MNILLKRNLLGECNYKNIESIYKNQGFLLLKKVEQYIIIIILLLKYLFYLKIDQTLTPSL